MALTTKPRVVLVAAVITVAELAGLGVVSAFAQPQAFPLPMPPRAGAPTTLRITIDEARQRVLSNSKLLRMAAENVQSKGHAIGAARADYFPKIFGSVIYFHFSDPLGQVITTQAHPILGVPAKEFPAHVFQQDSAFTSIMFLQPVTDLLKVRQGVRIAQTDEQIAQAQLEKGARELESGVLQLYWGLLAAQKIRAGIDASYRGVEQVAQSGWLEGRTALVETKQALLQVGAQATDLQEQLDILLDVPTCTVLELVEPPLPGMPVTCADEAVNLALQASPEVREAVQTIAKAEAATNAARLDFMPSIAVTGGWTNQTAATYIQPNFGFIGVIASYTFVDWGKRRHTIQERQHMMNAAALKYEQTEAEVRQNCLKAYRNLTGASDGLSLARELVGLRKEAESKALEQARTNPAAALEASKGRGTAEVDYVKADLAYRQAHVELIKLIGQ
jgi:outer membrane protein TolC